MYLSFLSLSNLVLQTLVGAEQIWSSRGRATPPVLEALCESPAARLSFLLCFSVSANSKEADHSLYERLASGYQTLPRHSLWLPSSFYIKAEPRCSLLAAPGAEMMLWAFKPLLPRLPAPKTLLPDALCSADPTESRWGASPQHHRSPCPLSLLQSTRLHRLLPVTDHKNHQHSH